jgi:epoxyqueuosine reductase
MKLKAREDLQEPELADLLTLDDIAFRSLFSGSPVKRIGRDRFVRNVLIAAGNSGEERFVHACKALARDASPTVRAMAVWALSRLLAADDLAAFARECGRETDDEVLSEWEMAGVSRCMS